MKKAIPYVDRLEGTKGNKNKKNGEAKAGKWDGRTGGREDKRTDARPILLLLFPKRA
jgi:hypothetical protein